MELLDPIIQEETMPRRMNAPTTQMYDTLTGLPGRKAAFAMLARAISLAKKCGRGVLAGLVDMDRFYLINETRGTAFGDEALRQMANRLYELSHWSCSVYRLSGNTFLLFRMLQLDTASKESERLIEELKSSVESLLHVRGQQLYTFCSIGVSSFPADGDTAELIVRHADTALRQAKAAGGNQVAVYIEDDVAHINRMEELRRALRTILPSEHLSLHYQPIYDAAGRLRGLEALLRWHHELLGNIPPGEFITLAEQSGQIVEIGEWVLSEVCRMIHRTRSKGLNDIIISVNLSPMQITAPGFVETLQCILALTNTPAECLEFEITESIMIVSSKHTTTVLNALRAMGVRIALDDFGIGYASLTYLRELPLHTLKLDRSFICHITEQHAEAAIVKAMISLVHELGFEAVAEGVETKEQFELLRSWGCNLYQGYLLGKPMQEDAICAKLQQAAL
ncbi:bifunctional diguanylate cyclase/phosphodiesterase [Paenibacillus sp. OV219]|uniref:putative bifunctional diguanylate cyclase/phosphodiesterase n=1 Tax=Paenibacillus sp. OV219 TaxID=1884377 RepID=UPI0008BB5AB5|nr:bifunctional diguanylate cyclase/phosphodiesterase [Paenibacillus sp. OV219]SEO40691.1 diguanylate cyclase (GGDEF) domain-containing protein [Paenibacillus sp. OV219]